MMYSGLGRLGSFGGIKRKMSGREWFVSNEQTCGGMRGGEDISWDAMWDARLGANHHVHSAADYQCPS